MSKRKQTNKKKSTKQQQNSSSSKSSGKEAEKDTTASETENKNVASVEEDTEALRDFTAEAEVSENDDDVESEKMASESGETESVVNEPQVTTTRTMAESRDANVVSSKESADITGDGAIEGASASEETTFEAEDGDAPASSTLEEVEAEFAFPEEEPVEDASYPVMQLDPEEEWGASRDPVIPATWRPILPLVIGLVGYFAMTLFWADLQYFFVDKKALELGDITAGCSDEFNGKLRHNAYVRVTNALPQLDLTTEVRVRFQKRHYTVIMGCDLLISLDSAKYKDSARLEKHPKGDKLIYKRFSAKGRLLRMDLADNLEPVRKFYLRSGVEFSKQTYILYDGETPRQNWWFLPIYIVLGGIMLMCVYHFLRALRDAWNQPRD